MAATGSNAFSPRLSPRHGASVSQGARLRLLHQSLCREIALQSGRAQRAVLEALDEQLDALRRKMANLEAGQRSQEKQLVGLLRAGGGGSGQSCSRSLGVFGAAKFLRELPLEASYSTSKGEGPHGREGLCGESTSLGLDDDSSRDCDDPSDHGSDEGRLGESSSSDCAVAMEKNGELFEAWARSELHGPRHCNGLAEFEVRLSKMDAAQRTFAESMDAKLTREIERIASEHRYGRTLIADVVSEFQDEWTAKIFDVLKERQEESAVMSREALNRLELKLHSEVSTAQEECRASLKDSTDSLSSQLQSDIAAMLLDQQAAKGEFQIALDKMQSNQVQALEIFGTKTSTKFEDVYTQLDVAHGCLLQLEVSQRDVLETQRRLDEFAADYAASKGRHVVDEALLDERLGQFSDHLGSFSVQLCEVEAKAVQGFPRRCAEHRESHFKALEALIRAEFDTKLGRLETGHQAAFEALDRGMREDLRCLEVDRRVGDAKILEELDRRLGPYSSDAIPAKM